MHIYLDFITVDKAMHIKDVTVIYKVNIGSDHRMVAFRVKFDLKNEGKKMILKERKYILIRLKRTSPNFKSIKNIFHCCGKVKII